jgi:hypothetical protein
MRCEVNPIALADEQKAAIYGILSVGCDRQTAADFVGCTLVDFGRAMRQDREFAASVRRTEATVELNHMRNVHKLATGEDDEKKEWRASVWWLERRSPERFGARSAGTVTARQLIRFSSMLAGILADEIHDEADRNRVLLRMDRVVGSLEQMLLDGSGETSAGISAALAEILVEEGAQRQEAEEDHDD